MNQTVRPIKIHLPGKAGYSVQVTDNPQELLARTLVRLKPTRILIVSDRTVWRLYGRKLSLGLKRYDLNFSHVLTLAGEANKNAENINRIYQGLLKTGCDRDSVVVALGGGIVGDLAGFAAATFYRGIRYIQVPTTLLAQIDSSVGGKTGYDLPEGKNLIGAFHHPEAVIIDVSFLKTLPKRQLRAALGEAVKVGMVRSAKLCRLLDRKADRILALDERTLQEVVRSCIGIKAEIVSQDERESGLRRILNFGHTIGHAIEANAGYRGVYHGEAVAMGMITEAAVGKTLGITPPEVVLFLRNLLKKVGLSSKMPKNRLHHLAKSLNYDKKIIGTSFRLFLPHSVGDAREVIIDRRKLIRLVEAVIQDHH